MDKTRHRKSKRKLAAAPAALVSLLLTGCINSSNESKPASTSSPSSVTTTISMSESPTKGGTGVEVQDQALVDQVAQDILKSDDSPITEEQAQCWANGIVTSLGPDRVKELGLDAGTGRAIEDLTGSDVSSVEAHDIVGAMFDCMDVRMMLAQSAQTPDEHIATDCIVPRLSTQELQDFIVADTFGIEPPPELATVLQQASQECAPGSGTATASSTTMAAAGANQSDQDFVGAVAQATVDSGVTPDMTIGRCWADGMNADFGVARMRELNLADPAVYNSGATMNQDEGLKAATSLDGCIDLKKLVVEQTDSPEARQSTQCQVDKLTDDDMKHLVGAILSGTQPTPELTTKFQDAIAQCGGG